MARAPWKAIAVVALLVAAGCPSSPRDEAPSGAGGKGGGGADAQGTSGTAGHGAGAGGAGGDGAGGATAAGSSGAGGGGAGGATATGSGGAGGGGAGGATATGSGGAGGGGAGGGGSWRCPALGDPCSTCLSLQCQESYCACLQNPECAALSNCLLGCDKGDARCAELCSAAHAPGAFDASLESACAAERCRVQCPSRLPLSGCRACRFTHCAEEMRACFASAPCMALLECVDACGADDATCRSACEVDHADGAQAAQAVLACGQDPCDGACR